MYEPAQSGERKEVLRKVTLQEVLVRFAVRADLAEENLPGDSYLSNRGGWNINNGTLAVVDTVGIPWVISLGVFSASGGGPINVLPAFNRRYQNGAFLFEALDEAGYERLSSIWVPHSNDSGTWMKKYSPVARDQLIEEIRLELEAATVSARLQKIAAIAASAPSA